MKFFSASSMPGMPAAARAFALSLFLLLPSAYAQSPAPAPLRPPATPPAVHDPYFSLWSAADTLTGAETTHWTGVSQPIHGIVRVDGRNYRFLGRGNGLPALQSVSQEQTPTRTIAVMTSPEIQLTVTFLNPALPEDLATMSRPVTYLTMSIQSRDGNPHDVDLYLDAAGELATNDPGEAVDWSRGAVQGLDLLRIGTRDQQMLQRFGDNVRIDWGWFYLAAPSGAGAQIAAGNRSYRETFLNTGQLPAADDLGAPRQPDSRYPYPPLLSVRLPLGSVGGSPVSRHVLLAYDDESSVVYMEQKLLPYWRSQFPDFASMLEAAEKEYPELAARCAQFDAELTGDLVRTGGPEYAAAAVLAYPQAIAAHKLVESGDGAPFFMPKENFSNGSISTVDVIYPSAPMFLLLNPRLVEAQLEPVLRYAESARWKFPFAPHDLGVYPLANGQLYGGGERSEVDQMPVEESADILLLAGALAHSEGNADFARRHWPLLSRWAEYLAQNGFDPANQLSTDDFAGHLAHNTNLSIKAIEALGVYAQLARRLNDAGAAEKYEAMARDMAGRWVSMADDGDHFRLAFDKPGTWSQKYNLVWDTILGLNLFPAQVAAKEIAFYKGRLNPYGLPLDNRATYTKLDWEMWTATLASNQEDFLTLAHPVYEFLNRTPDRVPMSDWYDTLTAHMVGFQARSVVGGVYIKMLSQGEEWSKWVKRSQAGSQP